MLFFRVEHKTRRRGIYYGRYQWPNANETSRWPMPCNDTTLMKANSNISHWDSAYRLGFKDMAQLKSWLYNDNMFIALHEHDFILTIYDVPLAYYGNSQAVIHSDYHKPAYIVKEVDLLDLDKPISLPQ